MQTKGEAFMERIKNMPVAILPTMVGAITLANFMQGLGYEWVRHVTLWVSALIWLVYLLKMIRYPQVCLKEYSNTVPRSLYAGFTMIMMGFAGYIFAYAPTFGKALWFAGIAIHACHILYFSIKAVGKNFSWDTFVPSWFVTYNGIMVSTVVGGVMQEPLIGRIIVYYGIAIYTLLIPFMVYRLAVKPIKDAFYHTQAIVLAPCSLCLTSYVNFIENKNMTLLWILYTCVLLSVLFIVVKLPGFFSFQFNPGFAGLTFPMAIGTVASGKMSGVLTAAGMERAASVIRQISGFQLYLTAMLVGYVLLQFFLMWRKTEAVR